MSQVLLVPVFNEDSLLNQTAAGPQQFRCTSPHPRPAHLAGTRAGEGKPGLPAVHQHRAHLGGAGGRGPPHEGQDGEGVLGDAHVRPLRVVVLDHHPLVLTALGVSLLTLEKGEHGHLYTECEHSGNSTPGLVRPSCCSRPGYFRSVASHAVNGDIFPEGREVSDSA